MATNHGTPRRRPTLKDIANQAGVSEAAASFALNNKPGVSEETREKIRAVALELDWSPSFAAKALAGSSSGAVGFVIARSAQSVGTESFFLRLMTGIQEVLARRRFALLLQVVGSVSEEIETYRRWQSENRVDGVVIVDLHENDPRPADLAKMGLPAIIVGGPDPTGKVPSVTVDDGAAMRTILEHLRSTGRTNIVYVSGREELLHIGRRIRCLHEFIEENPTMAGRSVTTDFSAASGAAATESVLTSGNPPDAVIYDNEVLALAGISVASRLGFHVPKDFAVVTWEDTAVSEAMNPSLTALTRDPFSFGSDVAERLLKILDGEKLADFPEHVPTLIVRESTGRS